MPSAGLYYLKGSFTELKFIGESNEKVKLIQ